MEKQNKNELKINNKQMNLKNMAIETAGSVKNSPKSTKRSKSINKGILHLDSKNTKGSANNKSKKLRNRTPKNLTINLIQNTFKNDIHLVSYKYDKDSSPLRNYEKSANRQKNDKVRIK